MRLALSLLAALAVAGSALAQTPAPPAPLTLPPPAPYGAPVTLQQAKAVMAAAEAEARRNGWNLAISVVEPSGELVLFQKMDGAGYGATAVSQAKARTAARFAQPTKRFNEAVAAGRLGVLGITEIVPVEGGVPLIAGGRTIGAIGVSGASSAQDGQVAQAGGDVLD